MRRCLRNAGVTAVILAAIACVPVLAVPVFADETENWEMLLNAAIAARASRLAIERQRGFCYWSAASWNESGRATCEWP